MHPIALNLGRFALHSYGIMLALGFMLGLWNASRRARRAGLPAEAVMDAGPWLILGIVAGARALYVATNWRKQFAEGSLLDIFAVWQGGLVFYGGLAGAVLTFVLYARARKFPLWKLADIFAPSIALGYVSGRIGCLLNGCCYGRACHLPWAIRFPEGNVAHAPAFPVHPTQLYESFLNLGLFAALAWFYPRRRFDGQVFAFYLIGYAVLRSFVECFRGDYHRDEYVAGCFTPGQVTSAFVLVAGLLLLWLLPRPAQGQSHP